MTSVSEDGLEQKPLPAIDRLVVMFVISRTYGEGISQERLYDATRGNWRIGAGTRAKAAIALGVADGVVRTAFEVNVGEHPTSQRRPGRRRLRITVGTLRDMRRRQPAPGSVCQSGT